jgi:hypothetical protein
MSKTVKCATCENEVEISNFVSAFSPDHANHQCHECMNAKIREHLVPQSGVNSTVPPFRWLSVGGTLSLQYNDGGDWLDVPTVVK